MSERRKSYRLPENKYENLKEKLDSKGIEFDEFLAKSIDLYLAGEINPKNESQEWSSWMEE